MAEAAGLALAIIPLLVSAVEHYEACLRPIERFIRFTTRVERFQRHLKVQRTVFLNQCRILLETVVERDVAIRMLQDKQTSTWQDYSIELGIEEQLDNSREACITVLSQISSTLEILETWSADLANAVQEEGKHHKIGTKAWRSVFKAKLKLSFKEMKLDGHVLELRELNNDLIRLYDQTSKLQKQQSHALKPASSSSHVTKSGFIRDASCKVYEALRQSCSKHTEHKTRFCLEAKVLGTGQSPRIQFQMAFMRQTVQSSVSASDPTFFIIESIMIEDNHKESAPISLVPTMDDCAHSKLTGNLKRGFETDGSIRKKLKRTVRFQCPAPCAPPTLYDNPNLMNLCQNRNFCDQLRNCLQQDIRGGRYVGTLDNTDCFKHLIYFPETITVKRSTHSLQEIMASRQGLVNLSPIERAFIARSLAQAVLQYHATPWLRSPLRCANIYLCDGDSEQSCKGGLSEMSELHIDVSITGANPVPESSNSLIPNIALYHLAVVLIELAFEANLDTLLNAVERSDRDRYTNFLAAKRLAGSVGKTIMGFGYQTIIQKCLGCHFAAGCDLSSSSLQTEYYKDIVQELQKLEEGFRSLFLDEK